MSYQWLNVNERKLELVGAILVALLCQTCKNPNLGTNISRILAPKYETTRTGFITAITNAKQTEAFLTAELCGKTIIDTALHTPTLVHPPPIMDCTHELVDELSTDESEED